MKEELISLFIDDEMNLDEKTVFVETIHADPTFTEETLNLLRQEKLLTIPQSINRPMPQPALHAFSFKRFLTFHWPYKSLAAGLVTAMLVFFIMGPEPKSQNSTHRFVIFEPGVERAEIAGSFSRWKPLPMKSTGRNGYWEVTIELAPGEYEYSYFLDGKKSIADPTVPFREEDDFGSSNSIIRIGI
jgi:hypothetical protein